MRRISAPTLFIQGTVDTLFTLAVARRNHRLLGDDVPARMLWFCGGHGTCTVEAGTSRVQSSTLRWFAKYLKGNDVRTGPGFAYVDQDGVYRGRRAFSLRPTGQLTASGDGTLPIAATPTSADAAGNVATPAANAVELSVRAPRRTVSVVGAPRLTFTYSGLAAPKATHLYAQVVDEERGVVLGNQATPVAVTLDGAEHRVSLPLEIVSWRVDPDARLSVQITNATTLYEAQGSTGSVDITTRAPPFP